MKHKTFKHSLAIGIIVFFTCTFSTCCRDCEGMIVRMKWIYINETPYNINYENPREGFDLTPYDTAMFENELEGVTEDVLCGVSFTNTPSVNTTYPTVVFYSNGSIKKCDTLLIINSVDRGVDDINRFECKKIDKNHFEFIFRYTQSDYNNAKSCN